MKLSLNWLSDFVSLTTTDPDEISRRVTAGVAEVDDIEVQGKYLDRVVVGRVAEVKKHPKADRLMLCVVETDDGNKNVVCGGTNVRAGMRVAMAHVGATVKWHGNEVMTLEKTAIRGEPSEGMICAAEELELGSRFPAKPEDGERPIIDLGEGAEGVGAPLKDYLSMKDTVIHIDNHAITHRADLFSHVGFAREFAALGLGKAKAQPKKAKFPTSTKAIPFKCIVDDKSLVPRYEAILIEVDGIGETPLWMKERLEATGWRSINLPIDITNYVATELGIPLHCFDADDIRGDVHMRASKAGETVTTLDGVDRKLPDGAIILSDDEGIFDLLGIMGGLRSSTKPTTRRMYLHAAIPDPVAIRKAVISTGHRTDAATVYEKGVPKIMANIGLDRAIELFLAHVPGARIASKRESWGEDGKAKAIDLPLEIVDRMLGISVPEKEVIRILESLEFEVKKKTKNQKPKTSKPATSSTKNTSATLIVTPPLYRLGDIRGTHDLVEEIGRVYGYDAIKATMPTAISQLPHHETRLWTICDSLKESAYTEILPVSFIGPALLKRAGFDPATAVEVENPIGEELSMLHVSTLPSLLAHAERNLLNAGNTLKTFHIAHVFMKGKEERSELSMLVADLRGDATLLDEPLLVLKRDLSVLVSKLGYTLDVTPANPAGPYAHPGRCGELLLRPIRKDAFAPDTPSIPVGSLFEIHPDVRDRFSLRHRAAAATIDLDAILALTPVIRLPTAVPQFPAITYDVTLPLSHREQAGPLLQRLRAADPLLEHVAVVDLYAGKDLPKEEYKLTVRFTYRAPERTLTEEEAKTVHDKIVQELKIEN